MILSADFHQQVSKCHSVKFFFLLFGHIFVNKAPNKYRGVDYANNHISWTRPSLWTGGIHQVETNTL